MVEVKKGDSLTLTDVKTNGTLADVTAGDTFEVLQMWYDSLGNTRASIGVYHDKMENYVVESHTVIVSNKTLTFAPDVSNINTVARYK